MKILNALIDSMTSQDEPVKNVCAGAFWTVVMTRYTFKQLHGHGVRLLTTTRSEGATAG